MRDWIKRHWILIVICTVVIFMLWSGISDIVQVLKYKSQIRKQDKLITEKNKAIKKSEKREKALLERIENRDARIAEKDEKLAEYEHKIEVIAEERDEWKKKVENMPPTMIVIETRRRLNCNDIWERPDGVLFSLSCARTNLKLLGDFSLTIKERDELKKKTTEHVAKEVDQAAQIIDLKSLVIEKEDQLTNQKGISANWENKFNLCEVEKKRVRRKGRKEGFIIGGIICGIAGFLLGK